MCIVGAWSTLFVERECKERQPRDGRHVLPVANAERHRTAVDRASKIGLPEQRARPRIQRLEIAFSSARKQKVRRRRQDAAVGDELLARDVSLAYVARLMNRRYTEGPTLRKVLQTMWYQVNNGQEIYVIGAVQDDGTVRGGTGWGAEFAKLCNKPLYVFDQDKDGWFAWTGEAWTPTASGEPVITHPHFTGTGTRTLRENGARAIEALFVRSFA